MSEIGIAALIVYAVGFTATAYNAACMWREQFGPADDPMDDFGAGFWSFLVAAVWPLMLPVIVLQRRHLADSERGGVDA